MNEIYPWQQDDWARLQSLRERASQGLLFQGMKGIGKLELAISYARALLCQHPLEGGFACGVCPSCHWFEQGSHPDFRFLQPESETEEAESGKKPSRQISVDQIRGLSDFLGLTAHQGGRRVVIIHPAEAMNANAANALLKNLEEPPPGLLFILVTHKPQALLPTLLSRCLTFSLAAPDAATAARWLAEQGVKNPADALAHAGFSPLQAMLGATGSDLREKLLRAIRQPALLDVFALADVMQKTEQVLVVQWLQQWCYDLMLMKMAGKVRYHPAEQAVIGQLVTDLDPLNLARLQSFLQTAKREAQHTLNAKLFFESLLFTYCQLTKPCHS
ncbi:MAG: DNA polymerase III subunit delta' [Proteobacteria bacterium]|nr:DNA polymerase III subunit delta' [Pseudomonadota bacterium]